MHKYVYCYFYSEHQSGLPVERQLLRYLDEDIEMDLKARLYLDLHMDHGAHIFVFNKGGYMTQVLFSYTLRLT